ncbi:glutamate receptor 1-like [Maniola jurtina]|uniref:glutamate receptor 1-like n=1 Tax=Maniola jurtina TaxID=191418 RepID=UPI001E688E3E|nr:glutamate receptor 1-like [Maniola jurtina]
MSASHWLVEAGFLKRPLTDRCADSKGLGSPWACQRSAIKHDEVHDVALGVVFEQHSEEIQEAFKFAMLQYSNSKNKTRLDFQLFVDIINTADAFKLSRLICHQFSRGVVSMLGAIPPDSFDTLHSYTNTFQVPFVTPWFPEKVIPPTSGLIDYAVSLRPDYHRAVIDTIVYYGWKHIIYIYDSHDGLLRLQQLYQSMKPGKAMFQITYVKRVTKAAEAIAFLVSLERMNRWSNKYVVLDCGTQLAKETLVLHVRDVELGRRNYHYFLTGLVMDNLSEKGVGEFGAINVTGFSILDHSRKIVQNFIEAWHHDSISAQAALMYDAVQVLIDSILRMLWRKPDFLRGARRRSANNSKVIDCNPKNALIPYEYGEKMSKIIKRTEMEGITGHIRFTEEGHRRNFTLQVMEMTVTGEIVKVGTWYDNKGYIPVEEKLPGLRELGLYDRNKTYIVSTIVEYPYVNKEKISDNPDEPITNLTGFCVDLTRLVLEKMEITYELRLVKDEKYGNENPKEISGWDGLIGELLRQEVDLVVAPLTVNRERQEVIDFSKPYLSFDTKPKRSTPSNIYTIFSFLIPLSKEIWFCIIGSLVGVSLCLFLVSKFSPREWRVTSYTEPHTTENNEIATTRTTVVNEFNLWNSIWFSLGSFLQQGSEIAPRSFSGRIVSAVWCFFALIVIATYTANMASFLTINRINEPLRSYTKVTKCPQLATINVVQDQMVPPPIQGEDGDHPWMGFISPTTFLDDEKPCELMISVTQSGVKEFAIAFPKGSKLRDGVNLALQALREEGELQRLIRIWFIDTKCATDNEIQGKELTLNQVAGLFYVLVGGLTLALMVALLEFILHGRSQAARAQRALMKALRENANRNAPENDSTPQRREPREEQERLEWNGGAYSGYYASESQGAATQEEPELQASFTQV